MRKLEDALTDCETAHGADPNESSTYMTALLYRMLGRPSSAQPLLEGAIGTPLELGRLYGLLAEIYELNGRLDEANRIRQRGQRKFPKTRPPPTLTNRPRSITRPQRCSFCVSFHVAAMREFVGDTTHRSRHCSDFCQLSEVLRPCQ